MSPLAFGLLALAAPEPLATRLSALAAELDLAAHAPDALELCADAAPGLDAAPLASLLAASLGQLGLPEVPPCPAVEGDDPARDRAARAAGFEWRVVARPDDEGLALELRAVDRGLWGPRDLAPVVAFAREARPTAETPQDPPPVPAPGVTLSRVLSTERPLRALAACDLDGDGVRELAAVGDDRVFVWRQIKGGVALAGEWSFGELARASTPVRAPIAGAVCGPLGATGATRLAVGHSSLERGAVLAGRAEGRAIRLERERSFAGLPIGQSGNSLLSAPIDAGRNRVGPAVYSSRPGEDRAHELARPVLELVTAPGASRGFALDAEYALVVLLEGPALGARVGTSGAGTALLPLPDGGWLLALTSRSPGASDRLRLVDPDGGGTRVGPLLIPGAIVASTSGAAGELWIAAEAADGARTGVFRLSLGEARP